MKVENKAWITDMLLFIAAMILAIMLKSVLMAFMAVILFVTGAYMILLLGYRNG